MKRVFALLMALMALTMMLTLTACGGDEPEETPAPEQTEPKAEKKGCGAMVGFSVLFALVPAAVVLKKKRD